MPYYTVTEPHPTVAQSSWTHAGRGGAGNHFRAPPTTAPSGVPTPLLQPTLSHSSTGTSASSSSSSSASTSSAYTITPSRFYSGRGGAGNAQRQTSDFNPVTSFEDEFSRADVRERMELGSGYHVGRGGAGNFRSGSGKKDQKKERKDSASSVSSGSSSGSARSSILGRLGLKR